MLRVLGSTRTVCDGLSRRELLRVGGLGLAGASLPQILNWQAQSAASDVARPRSFGKAKGVILIHLYGSPSQLETVDPKPDAPVEIRGEFGCIPSSLPGCNVCELFPNLAKVMDRTTVLRSMTHPYPLHGVAFATTGVPVIDVAMELSPRDPKHWPYFGSVVDYIETQRQQAQAGRDQAVRSIPQNVALPFPFSTRRVGEVPRAGPYAAFLGSEYNPVWTDFVGTATKSHIKTLRDMTFTDNDPYIDCSDDTHFVVPSATSLQGDMTLDRLDTRRTLVQQLEQQRRHLAATEAGLSMDRYRSMTYAMLQSDSLRDALDVRKEPHESLDLYGSTLFGRSLVAARRLIEAGTKVVSVFWDEYGLAGTAWDTHHDHFARMKNELCPGLDRGWYGLITDLDRRGMLDDVLVVCTSEHGRTPSINKAKGGGRDHWARVYSTMMAGGGVKRGSVVGASDKHGGDVARDPISPKDMLATMYHLLGIDPHTWIQDALGRPLPLVDGKVLSDVLA
ncbi:MAG: DUF1501 domain-containing protein [Planctomycetaceae bacterium]|nr:DUF1501 domain-containing protein [Planctomycetaceae bacterium]